MLLIWMFQLPRSVEFGRDIRVIFGHFSKMVRSPEETFEEDARRLHKISVNLGAVEPSELGYGQYIVHSVTNLMEQTPDFSQSQKRWS